MDTTIAITGQSLSVAVDERTEIMNELVIVAQNIGRGGNTPLDPHATIPPSLRGRNRWEFLTERISRMQWPDGTTSKPAIVALTECRGWDEERLAQAAADLNLAPIEVCPSLSGNGPGMLYDADQLDCPAWNTAHFDATRHGFGVATFTIDVQGEQFPLSVAAAHLTPFSPVAAEAEAQLLASRAYRDGANAVVVGDMNYLPLTGSTYSTAHMRPYNRASRLIQPRPFYWQPRTFIGRWAKAIALALSRTRPNLAVAKTLYANELFDTAALMYQRTNDKSYLNWTSPTSRVDWACLSKTLVPSLIDYQILDSPPWASDHHGIAIRLNLNECDLSDEAQWQYT